MMIGFTALLLATGLSAPTAAAAAVPAAAANPRLVERLRAHGLRADDPHLADRLAELARARKRPAAGTTRVRFDAAKINLPKNVLLKYAGPLAPPPAVMPPGMGVTYNGSSQPKPVIASAELGTILGLPFVSVTGANFAPGGSYASTSARVTFAACGQKTLDVVANSNTGQQGTSLTLSGVFVAKATPATMVVTVAGVASDPVTFQYPAISLAGTPIFTSATLPIAASAPFLTGDGGIGFPGSAFTSTASAPRISTNVNGSSVSGTDTVGYGINLVNGWTATATIANVHSMLDAPGNGGANDQFRNATVVQQPQSGRLETKIAWTYEPGESLSYDVVWQFSNGVFGTRQVATQPKQTTCSDEE